MHCNAITSKDAPAPIGPFSQAIAVSNDQEGVVYLSGQVAIDPATGKIDPGGIEAQTVRVFSNIVAILTEAGLNLTNVVKTTVFLKDMDDFAKMNSVYSEQFGQHRPARTTVEVSRLPLGALVEVECIAFR